MPHHGDVILQQRYTVNVERFAGLNFQAFHGFQEYRESFSMNMGASLQLY